MMAQSNPELAALLPFYVNGSLSSEERRLVETGLDQDPDLREALDQTRMIYAEMQDEPLPHRVDTGFARLMKAIDQTPQDPPVLSEAAAPAQTRSSPVLKFALAAAFVALVVQAAVFWRADTGFNLASGGGAGAMTVAFQPDATESDIRRLLMELDLQIVSGPSSLGLYQLKGDGSARVLEALLARTDIVESAENAME